MQLGFVGLGKMGGNMVHRIHRDSDHKVVAFDFNADAVSAAEGHGATGASSLEDLVAKLEQAAHGLADGARRRPDRADRQRARRPARRGRHDRRRRQHELARRRAPRRRAARARHPLRRRRHLRRRLGPRGRLLHDGRRPRGERPAAGADPRRARPAGRLAPLRRRRRGPLREDGPQRRGVRDDAGLRRGLRADAQVEVRRRPQGGRRPLEPRLGRPLVAVRAGRAGVRRGGQRPRGAEGPRQRLRRGPLDDHRRDRPRRADAGDHRLAVRPLLLARRGRLHAPGARRAAQPVRGPRRRATRDDGRHRDREPADRGPRAAPGPADHAGDLRRDRRPRAAQAAAGALQPRARGRAAGALQPGRRLAPRPDRRRVPRPGARGDRAVLAPQAGRAAARRARRAGCATSGSRSTTRRLREARRGDGRARRGGRPAAQPRLLPLDRAGVLPASSPRRSRRTACTGTSTPRCAR